MNSTTLAQAQCLHSVELGALLDLHMPPRTHLLSPWLREQESVLVWAAAGVGKTMLTLSLALAMAGGGSLLGWTAPQPRRVLLIDGEMPLDDLQGRLRALAGTVEGMDLGEARRNLQVLARHHQHPDVAFPDFGAQDQQEAIVKLIRSYRPDVVILDNLSTLATLDDENGAAETQRIVRLLARLKQAKIAVVVVHHSGKSGTQFRGSSMLATTFEAILGLTREKGQDLLDGAGKARFQLKWDKFRGKRDPSVGDRSVSLEETPQGLVWRASLPRDEVLHALAELVRSGRFGTQEEAGRALPDHLWPTQGTPPSTGWISKQFGLAVAKGIISKPEIEAQLEAARAAVESDDI
jgi:KaiC/GvpD/RAD55 family RecA-like ATPase